MDFHTATTSGIALPGQNWKDMKLNSNFLSKFTFSSAVFFSGFATQQVGFFKASLSVNSDSASCCLPLWQLKHRLSFDKIISASYTSADVFVTAATAFFFRSSLMDESFLSLKLQLMELLLNDFPSTIFSKSG